MAKILWLTSQAKTHRQIIISIDSGKSKYFPASKKKNPESEKKGKLKKKILNTFYLQITKQSFHTNEGKSHLPV